MAKKTKEFSFGDLDKSMTEIDSLGSIMSENTFSKVEEWISTGNYLLNAQISGSIFKGVPNSRSIVFSGTQGTGKTFVALNSCRELQKMGYHVIYGDSEAAVDEEIMVKFGIDPDKVRYQPLKTVLQTRHFITNLCAMIKEKKAEGYDVPKIAMVIDSVGNLATEKESADALSGSEKRDMTKQQNLKSMFRIITTDLAELKIPLYMTNHVYAAVGSYIPYNVQSGGSGPLYSSSIILEFGKSALKEDTEKGTKNSEESLGIVVTSKVVKNRFARPLPIKFHISFYKGMNPYIGLENYISWDVCGIERGNLVEEVIETPVFEEDGVTPKMLRGKQRVKKIKTGKFIFEPNPKARGWAVKHLNKVVRNIFTEEVFTQEVLEKLDEVIRPIFELPTTVMDSDDLSDIIDAIEDEA